jgi:hypothetical protein
VDKALDAIWVEIKRAQDAEEKPNILPAVYDELRLNLDQLILWGLRIAGQIEDPAPEVLDWKSPNEQMLREVQVVMGNWYHLAPEVN